MVGAVLGEAGITAVLVTHDQAEALSFANTLAVLREGRLVQVGEPYNLCLHPTDPATARFLGDAIILRAMISQDVALTVLGPAPLADGASRGLHTVMLRPDQVHVVPSDDPETISRGLISGVSFHGSTWRAMIEHIPSDNALPAGSAARDS